MKITLTVATPEAFREDAEHLAVALGWSEGWSPQEWTRAFTAKAYDGEGALYRVMSCPVSASFVTTAALMGPIDRPEQDVGELDPETGEYGPPYVVNLAGAHRAQERLVIWQPTEPMQPMPQAGPDRIIAVVGLAGRDALEAIGLASSPPIDLDIDPTQIEP